LFSILVEHKRTSRPLDFFSGKDAVSVFLRYCWTALWALSFLPFCAPLAAIYTNPRVVVSAAYPRFLGSAALFALSLVISKKIWAEKVNWQWMPVFFMGGCLVYLIVVEPFAPLSFLALLGGYWLLGKGSGRITDRVTEAPPIVQKLVAAALRSVREVAILSATGFGFAVMGQVYVISWALFDRDAIWVWEGMARGLARLPKLDWRLVAVVVVGLALVSLMNPKSEWVRRATTGVKIYKKCLALVAILASFTFMTSTSVASLHHKLLMKHRHPEKAAEAMADPLTITRRTAYLCSRIASATASERMSLKKEFMELARMRDEATAEAAAERLARDLDPSHAAGFDEAPETTGATGETGARPEAETPVGTARTGRSTFTPAEREAIFAECRLALLSTLKDLSKTWFDIHTNNDFLEPFAGDLLSSFRSSVLDAAIPKNLSDLASMRAWVSEHMRVLPVEIPAGDVEPNWNDVAAEAGIHPVKLGFFPGVLPVERMPVRPDGVPEVEPVIPERPVIIPEI
jgi:hypothetical protein